MSFKVRFSEAKNYKPGFTDPKTFNVGFNSSTASSGTNDHNKLRHRDMDDQHPISAITGLEEALEHSRYIENLLQNDLVILNCGTSTENV